MASTKRMTSQVTFAYFNESWMIMDDYQAPLLSDNWSLISHHDGRFNPPEKWVPLMATIKCLDQRSWKTECCSKHFEALTHSLTLERMEFVHSKIHWAENLTETAADSAWALVTTSLFMHQNLPLLSDILIFYARPTLSRLKWPKLWM